jgi:very-short-patch-repair endonuclease
MAFLKGKQMYGYDFHRQKPLLDFIVDFYCYELNLVIELDGITHHFEDTQLNDTHKEDTLKSMGLHIIRFLDEEVMDDIDNVLRTIEAYINNFELNLHTPDPSQEGKFGK